MKPNRVKRILSRGGYAFGAFMGLGSPAATEMMAGMGFDWLLIDMEHSPGDYQTLLWQLQAIAAAEGNTVPVVRVQGNEPNVIKRTLDTGAMGIMIPGIRTVADAERAVAACKYPPLGFRGVAGVRASGWGRDADYQKQINREVLVIPQIETVDAMANLEGILSVKGVDVAFLGPGDLSWELGQPGQSKHPSVQKAFRTLEAACRKHKVALGSVSASEEEAAERIKRGYRFLSIKSDVRFLQEAALRGIAFIGEQQKGLAKKKK